MTDKFDTEIFKNCKTLNDVADLVEKESKLSGTIPEQFTTSKGIKQQFFEHIDDDPDRDFCMAVSLMKEGNSSVGILYVFDKFQNYIHDHVEVIEGDVKMTKFYSPHIDKTFIRCYDSKTGQKMDYAQDGNKT